MKIRCFYYETPEQIIFNETNSKFFSFKYLHNISLNNKIITESLNVFIKDIKEIRKTSKSKEYVWKSQITKLPFLYKDLKKEKVFRMPIVFSPRGTVSSGYGRVLISSIYFPETKFDCIFQEKNISNLKVLDEIIDKVSNNNYWKHMDLSGIYANFLCSIEDIEEVGKVHYLDCLEFENETEYYFAKKYGAGAFIGELEDNFELWYQIYEMIKNFQMDESNVEDYKKLLNKIVFMET